MIYFLQNTETRDVKIGYTNNNLETRVASLQTGSAARLEVIAILPGGTGEERALHRLFSTYRKSGEWFQASLPMLYYLLSVAKVATSLDPNIRGRFSDGANGSLLTIPFRRYEEFKALYDQGLDQHEMAREMDLNPKTIRKYRRKLEAFLDK